MNKVTTIKPPIVHKYKQTTHHVLSNDENIERIADLVEETKQWLTLKKEYTKLDLMEKLVKILSTFVIVFIIALLALLALIYLSFAAAYYLAEQWQSMPMAFFVISLVYIILLYIVYNKRHTWIEKPIVRLIIGIFKDEKASE